MKVVETIYGYFSYHLSETGRNGSQTLCNRRDVMQTSVLISSWGKKSHLGEKWCEKCWRTYNKQLK